MALWLGTNRKLSILVHPWKHYSPTKIINKEKKNWEVFIYIGTSVWSVIPMLSWNLSRSFVLSGSFALYSLYIEVKYSLHLISMVFKDSSDAVQNDISYTYHMTAIYDGSPFFCSFLSCLYNTYYIASLVIDIRHVLLQGLWARLTVCL